jgi:hypothetical protein
VAQFWFVETSVIFHVSEATAEGPVELLLEQLKNTKQANTPVIERHNRVFMEYSSGLAVGYLIIMNDVSSIFPEVVIRIKYIPLPGMLRRKFPAPLRVSV